MVLLWLAPGGDKQTICIVKGIRMHMYTSNYQGLQMAYSITVNCDVSMVSRTVALDCRMILLDNQACQRLTCHFKLSFQCNISPITGFIRYVYSRQAYKPVMGETLHYSDNLKWQVNCWHTWSSKRIILLSTSACLITFMKVVLNCLIHFTVSSRSLNLFLFIVDLFCLVENKHHTFST